MAEEKEKFKEEKREEKKEIKPGVKKPEAKPEAKPEEPKTEPKPEEKPEEKKEKFKEDKSSSHPSPPKEGSEKEEKPAEKKPEKEEEKEEEPVEVPKKFQKLVEEIEKMTVLDLAELVKVLEKKFGVSSAAPVAVAPSAPSAAPAGGEKSVFNIQLTQVGEKKIEVIKVVRDITGKGLKDSKDLVDAAASSPQMVKENVKKEEAEEMKKKFEAAGAQVELK